MISRWLVAIVAGTALLGVRAGAQQNPDLDQGLDISGPVGDAQALAKSPEAAPRKEFPHLLRLRREAHSPQGLPPPRRACARLPQARQRRHANRLHVADIYSQTDFMPFCAKYTQSGDPLFIPETRGDMDSKMLYVFGRHDAIGLTLMGVERATTPDPQLTTGCEMITQLAPLIAKHQGDGSMSAVMLAASDPPQKVKVGNYTMQVAQWPPGLRRRRGRASRRHFSLRSGLTNTMPWAIA